MPHMRTDEAAELRSRGIAAGAVGAAVLLGGAAGLVCEIVWARYLHLVFGVSAYAVMTVLVAFMAGFAGGSWHLGRWADRLPDGRRLLAAMLALLGLFLFLSPWIYEAFAWAAAAAVRAVGSESSWRHLLRFLLAMAVLLLPAWLLGGMVPVAVRLTGSQAAKSVGWLYALNTLGGAASVLAASFLLMPTLGLSRTLAIAGTLCFLGSLLVLSARHRATQAPPAAAWPAEPAAAPVRLLLLVFAISGFAALAYQVLWTRVLTLFFKDSSYDLAVVLAAFLAGIVIGGFLGGLLSRGKHGVFWVALLQVLIGFCALAGLHLIARFPYWLNDLQTHASSVQRHGDAYWLWGNLRRLAYAMLLMLAPATCFGAMYPIVSALWIRAGGNVGRRVGAAGAINTLGAAAGALCAGTLLLRLGTAHGLMILAWLNVAAALLMLQAVRGFQQLAILAMIFVAVLTGAFAPAWGALRMSASFVDPRQTLEDKLSLKFYKEDAQGMTAVLDVMPDQMRFLVTNRLYGQNTSDMGGLADHRRLGHLPLMLHPDPRETLVVGLGAGITLRGAVEMSAGNVDCVELSAGVVEASHLFSAQNASVFDHPRVKFFVNDGRNYLSTTSKNYDAIVLDIFHPMSAGSSAAFSREYYLLCRQRLKPGGLVCQWLPAHQLSLPDLKSAVATFRSVFPHVSLWYGMFGGSPAVIGCVGTLEPQAFDAHNIARRIPAGGPALTSLHEVNLDTPALVLSHFIMADDAVDRFAAGSPLDTDDRPVLEFSAPRLAARSQTQGARNLRTLAAAMTDPPAAAQSPEIAAEARKAVAVKKLVMEALEGMLQGESAEWVPVVEESLREDPRNTDLLWLKKILEEKG
jgi:spermidine synthase